MWNFIEYQSDSSCVLYYAGAQRVSFLLGILCLCFRLFSSWLEAGEPAVQWSGLCEDRWLWSGTRDALSTSVHWLCLYTLVCSIVSYQWGAGLDQPRRPRLSVGCISPSPERLQCVLGAWTRAGLYYEPRRSWPLYAYRPFPLLTTVRPFDRQCSVWRYRPRLAAPEAG